MLNTTLDLAAAALRIAWGVGGSEMSVKQCKVCEGKTWWVIEYGFCLGRRRSGMLGVGQQDLTGGHLLEWMPLHMARRAANVGGRSGVA